jgi:hypothetical protein
VEALTEKAVRLNFSLGGHNPATAKDSTTTVKETTMIDENLARLRAHRNNTHRYRRLLATRLSEVERAYILRRLQEEEAACAALIQTTFPISPPSARHSAEATA